MISSLLYDRLRDDFRPDECTDVVDLIGLQKDFCPEITRVYTATFAGTEVMDQLFMRDAHDCLLFTHHPSPQRKSPFDPPGKVPQSYWKELEDRRIALFSYHIPLDRNGSYSPGNNLAKHMGLSVYDDRFYYQDLVYMGVLCDSPFHSVWDLSQRLKETTKGPVRTYLYGDETLMDGRVAIMAGGASNPDIYRELAQKGINAFITGVTNPKISWVAPLHEAAKRFKVTLIGGTHCATEKFAPMEMVKYFERLGLPAEFIDEMPREEET